MKAYLQDSNNTYPLYFDVIIPVYNEANLSKVVNDIVSFPFVNKIIIVDDGSEYFYLEKHLESHDKVKVIHNQHQGKTLSVLTGAQLAETEYLVLQDADLEYPTANIQVLVDFLVKGLRSGVLYDMIVARRMIPIDKITFSGVVANRIITRLLRCPDVFSGQRVVKRELLISIKQTSKLLSNFTLETLLTCKALKENLKVQYVDSFYYPRGYKEGKKAKYYHMLPILTIAFYTLLTKKFKKGIAFEKISVSEKSKQFHL